MGLLQKRQWPSGARIATFAVMLKLVRIAMIILSLVLTTGATVQAAAAAEMKIAMSGGDGKAMKGCSAGAIESPGKATSCDLVCSAHSAAILPDAGARAFLQVRTVIVQQADLAMTGLATGPDPSPPGTAVLG